jgi:hypothetical protein
VPVRSAAPADAAAIARLTGQLGYPVAVQSLAARLERLLAAEDQWAFARGLGEVSVRSAVSRAESHPFYEQLGYERVKSQHVYRKRLTAAGAA